MPITTGLMPTRFADGLEVWSSGDGTPGSDTYAESGGGVFVPADQDFGGALEILKTAPVQKLRYMGQTPVRPGLVLRITARVKAVSGPLPSVRIAGWAGRADGSHADGLVEAGPEVALTEYGRVVEVSAILAPGRRAAADLVWTGADHGHLGLDLTGANGGVVRVDDIGIEDVTHLFAAESLGYADVRDYGALGDGVADDSAAFEAADADAGGREVLVPEGTWRIARDVTFRSKVRFVGRVVPEGATKLILQRDFRFGAYLDALGDEALAFAKAFQALLSFSDHESLDLEGRRIGLPAPLDMAAAVPDRPTFAIRRVVRNGQFQPIDGPAWTPGVTTAQARYAAADPLRLTEVENPAAIAPGSLVTGAGVGREVYVRAVDVANRRITLSQPLYDAEGLQSFTFTRFRYLLDFSGFDDLSKLQFDEIEFQCEGRASGVLLPPAGLALAFRDCFFTKPRDRGLTSHGGGCQGLMIDRCQFLSNEQGLPVGSRRTLCLNANANDVKIRDSRIVLFEHFCVLAGTGNIIANNHWFHGDGVSDGVRKGGIVFTRPNVASTVTGNYIDNNFIEWTNEHDATPALGQQFSFGGLTVTGNIFIASDVARWFNWIVVKPYGPGHFIHGLHVTGNVFRTFDGNIDRIERVDTAFADLDYGRMRDISFAANTFNGINQPVRNPASLTHDAAAPERVWVVPTAPHLPFSGRARVVEAAVAEGKLARADGQAVHEAPWIDPEHGADRRAFRLIFATPVSGRMRCLVRMDNPA
ncbi:glycosyl hydrolase family 28-related protein [Limimaricola pyoseonensis]|uniref:Pectate lyase superfamily protein n=1 Tax=Limimaricola pyoseonensis TaxID=521013 RepID=A0A1G7G5P8_9RHOB|nr:glycosyl hydrolase family 28-related protein [Limimaricola pyoseonensis]SDE83433.1 Pectate lyase superfamily protein [Limimaricola pyoseonensis]